MNRRQFLARATAGVLTLSAAGSIAAAAEQRGLNVLFIFADQLQRYAMGCMGNADVHTPNLDRLAAEGVLFRNAYAAYPVCTPFRMSMVTGLYCSQTGVMGNSQPVPQGCRTIADEFNANGYQTGFVGKWHIGGKGNVSIPKELRGGFTYFNGYQCYNGFRDAVEFRDENDQPTTYDKHRTDVTADLAIAMLEKMAAAERPFALYTAFQAPHYPVQPAPEYEAMYRGATIHRRPNVVDIDPYTQTFSPPSPDPHEDDPDFQRYGNNLDEYLRLYYAMVTQVDANVGRILDTLEHLGLKDNTAVIFTADHGDMQGSHGLKNKSVAYEESAGIPLIVRVPGGARGLVSDALIGSVDYFPTCLDYAGIPIRLELPGHSFAPLTRGEAQEMTGPVFSETPTWIMIRKGNYKLVVAREGDVPKDLFDLKSDPYEMHNLVDDPAHADIRNDLHAQVVTWHNEVAVLRF